MDMLPNFNPMAGLNEQVRKQQEEMERVAANIARKRAEEENRQIRSLEIQEESLENEKLILFLMQCLNKDNKEIIQKLQGLINTVDFGNKVGEANLLIIQRELEAIKEDTTNIHQNFVNIAKEKLAEKGVEYTIMFILQGLKQLFLKP